MAGRPRITGGRLRGRALPVPVPRGARPSTARVREALFSMIGQDLAGARVLDAFSGSGLLALEAWSRGAEVVAVERDPGAARAIRRAARALGAHLDVRVGDALRVVHDLPPFDVVIADPPYRRDPEPIVAALGLRAERLVLEADRGIAAPEAAGPLVLDRSRVHGGSALHLYVRPRPQ